jgi:hypothetical protein
MADDLIAAIKKKQALVSKLQAELDEARTLLESGLQETKGLGRAGHPDLRASGSRRKTKRGKTGYKHHSSVGRAIRVLKKANKPLHIDELISLMEKRGRKVKKTTMVGNLARYIKAGRMFSRPAPSTFGLIEWSGSATGTPIGRLEKTP